MLLAHLAITVCSRRLIICLWSCVIINSNLVPPLPLLSYPRVSPFPCSVFPLQVRPPRKADALDGGLVDEPAASVSRSLVDESAGQTRAGVEDLLHDILLAAAGGNKSDADGVRDDGQRQGDSLGGRLGRVLDGGDPGVGLAEQLVAGEEGAGVAVGPAAEQQQVKDGQADRVAGGEAGDERLLVLVGELLDVAEVLRVDCVHGGGLLVRGQLVEQLGLDQGVVGVLVVQRHRALVGEEDFPLGEVDRVFGAGGGRQQGRGERLGQRASRHGHLEDAVSLNTGVLALDYVCAQSLCEGIGAREGV